METDIVSPLAPILLFTYKRLETLQKTVQALQNNHLASDSVLYIFSDGYKGTFDQRQVEKVRSYIKTISGFKKVIIKEAHCNKGLANSIIQGVSEILDSNDKAVVLEDDLITSRNFLNFMNTALNYYENNKNVFSVSGYSFPFKIPNNYQYDCYTITRGCSWGWGTWKDRWETVDWKVSDYDVFLSSVDKRKKFSKSGSDLIPMLKKQMNGSIDSWAIRWYYQQSKNNQYTVYPTTSKVANNGFDQEATHTTNYNRYKTVVDNGKKDEFIFEPSGEINDFYQKYIQKKFSVPTRIVYGTLMSQVKKMKELFR
ncbi:sugar transferase [Pontibacter cellulosilyticus]|uniref:Sugar transferase n=1 Tax=Pontibacter cellulosilyticus TaxID=1720253 RepID=A0A923SI84_9BACT|nr:sugar transferase [Pontibacter cellulosilyticus]MBC5992529.1 sugar transferase [Pontibacter cellulosilyticus]